MSNFIVIGYYTKNTFYENHSKVLIKSLEKYNILYHIEEVENLGNWFKNVNYKPTFVKKMMKKFPEMNIVYVDCDAEFFGYPELFDKIEENIAVHLFDRSRFHKKLKGLEVLSGTIFLKNNEETYSLVERWEEECKRNPHKWDQKSLEKILNGKFYHLPEEYCQIHYTRYKTKNPIIVHYQASKRIRKNKGKIPRKI